MESPVDSKAQPGSPAQSQHSANDGVSAVKSEPSDVPSSSHLETVISPLPLRPSCSTGTRSLTVEAEANAVPSRMQEDTNFLERLCTQSEPEVLESGVPIAKKILDQLRDVLNGCNKDSEFQNWIKAIDDLQQQARPPRTVLGVVGITGAGKSSLINALLDEERLLPTSCLRACTASPIEVSFNYSDDPLELYRAEIEFISTEDWIRDLNYMFSDLLDANGKVSREASSMEGDAGVAYQKIKAVYPQKTREMLAQASPQALANEIAVRNILGTKKVFKSGTAKGLYSRLQHYVDSKEKLASGATGQRKKLNDTMEYWPLIKVVRIYTKAKALSTGAVVVDLPGSMDSNSARAAVTENYKKFCTGIWIVAEITRAVDNKTAKTLLGDSFRRQLKYDGTYESVSFICSKTDEISVIEAAESLGLETELYESWSEAEAMRRRKESLETQVANKKQEKATLNEELEECDLETDELEELKEDLLDGKDVYAPERSNKRKRGTEVFRSRKNMDHKAGNDNSELASSDEENLRSEDRRPLTKEDIEEQLSEIKMQRKKMRNRRRLLDSKIAEYRAELRDIEANRDRVLAELKADCINGRNKYSTEAIKQDFAAGIKELDQENAAEENDEAFDPGKDIRDYSEVARSLPVFCVSSRAYQKLSGRLEKDNFQSHGFLSIEDTGIPDLQAHTQKLTEVERAKHCGQFLNGLSQLVNSMKLWCMSDSTQLSLTNSEKRQEAMHVEGLLDELNQTLKTLLESSMTLLQKSLTENIYMVFGASVPYAIQAAPDTVHSWGQPRSQGGLSWATYKATVRRDGVFSGAAGLRNFNEELFDPISRNLANGWERAFQQQLPVILESFGRDTAVQLRRFHEAARGRAEERGINVSGLSTLSSQVIVHARSVEALMVNIGAKITEIQREANRGFTPAIVAAMRSAYQACTNESGQGSYARMKVIMGTHVEYARHSMFHTASSTVRGALDDMCDSIKQEISTRIKPILDIMHREYMRTLGIEANKASQLEPRTKEERDALQKVHKILLRSDIMFAPALVGSMSPTSDTSLNTLRLGSEKARTGEEVSDEMPDASAEDAFVKYEGSDDVTPLVDRAIADEADDLIQADIREQGLSGDYDVEDDFSDIMNIVKEESR